MRQLSRAATKSRARPRRLEAMLLAGAILVVLAAACTVQIGSDGHVDGGTMLAILAVCAGAVLAHIAIRLWAPKADPLILPVAFALSGIGWAQLASIDHDRGDTIWEGDAGRQLVWWGISLAAAVGVLVAVRNPRTLARSSYTCGALGLLLLFSPQIPGLGVSVGGSARWIAIGNVSFQPGEPAKVLLAVAFAGYLAQHGDAMGMVGRTLGGFRFPRLRDTGPLLLLWAATMCVLVFQRDLGTSVLLLGTFTTMVYLGTRRTSWLVGAGGLSAAGVVFVVVVFPYVADRFSHWLRPFDTVNYEAENGSYQLVQGIFGFAHGGLIGKGWGRGQPTVTPLAESDYILSSLGEELGLAGVVAVLMLYLVLASRGLRIGLTGPDEFTRILGAGLGFLVAFQVFIVLGGITRLIPVTGLPAPFLAAGGSSLVGWWSIAAVLLLLSNRSAGAARRKTPREPAHRRNQGCNIRVTNGRRR